MRNEAFLCIAHTEHPLYSHFFAQSSMSSTATHGSRDLLMLLLLVSILYSEICPIENAPLWWTDDTIEREREEPSGPILLAASKPMLGKQETAMRRRVPTPFSSICSEGWGHVDAAYEILCLEISPSSFLFYYHWNYNRYIYRERRRDYFERQKKTKKQSGASPLKAQRTVERIISPLPHCIGLSTTISKAANYQLFFSLSLGWRRDSLLSLAMEKRDPPSPSI